MYNYQVTFQNGPTIIVQANTHEMACITASAQTGQPYTSISSVLKTGNAY